MEEKKYQTKQGDKPPISSAFIASAMVFGGGAVLLRGLIYIKNYINLEREWMK